MEEIKATLQDVSTGNCYYAAFPVLLLLLLMFFKGRRIRFAAPALIISLFLVNPVFYKVWSKIGLYGYWRILWILPIIPVCAAVPGMIAEKLNRLSTRLLSAVICLLVFIICGTFMYTYTNGDQLGSHAGTTFLVPAPNAAKLPQDVVSVGQNLLALEEQPRVIADPDLMEYLRQYSSNIDMLYGRDVRGYIYSAGVSPEASSVYQALMNPNGDMSIVAQVMLNDGYDFLVVNNTGEERQIELEKNRFQLVSQVSVYGIYTIEGIPAQSKERNELGQVISVTTLDETGNPVNGEAGYAVVSWEYDKWGNKVHEFRTDAAGHGVPDKDGFAGWERVYNERGQMILKRTLGPDGNLLANNRGYAELQREYRGKNLIRESYYDAEGRPVNRVDTGCASISYKRNFDHQAIETRCYNADGDAVRCSSGWSVCRQKYRGDLLISEAYYDTDESVLPLDPGYASMSWEYDSAGNVTAEAYFDAAGQPVNTINGYAREERQYDSSNNLISIKYFGADGNPICISTGYAEVRREYNSLNKLVNEAYFDETGDHFQKAAGYCSFEQDYDPEGNLIHRRYLDPDGLPVQRSDGFSEAKWEKSEEPAVRNLLLYNINGDTVSLDGINLAVNIQSDGWSNWMMPTYNTANSCFYFGYATLGEKTEGDVYTCQVEIEFSDVAATEGQKFGFRSQGSVDGSWSTGNVWNSNLVSLSEPAANGIYSFTTTSTVNKEMVTAGNFALGFRCDYWASGAFRVRNVKVERGNTATSWSPGL